MRLTVKTYISYIYISLFSWFVFVANAYSNNVKFEMVNGLMIIEANIDGEMGHYIFDTGADAIILNRQAHKGKVVSFTCVSGDIKAYETRIKELHFGNLVMQKIDAFTSDLSDLESYTNRKICGILGSGILAPHVIEIDYCEKSITTSNVSVDPEQTKFKRVINFNFENGVPMALFSIGMEKYNLILDTGATSHFISDKVRREHKEKFHDTGEKVFVVTGESNNQESSKYFLEELNFETGTIENLKFCVKDFDMTLEGQGTIDGIISLSKLGVSKIVIDLHKNQIYF